MIAQPRLPIDKDKTGMAKIFAAPVRHRLLILGFTAMVAGAPAARAATVLPENFATPQQAVDALVAAARNTDPKGLLKIFGPAGRDLVSSGDPIADKNADAGFVEHYGKRHEILLDTKNKATLVLGDEEWPFPIPLVRHAKTWHFDAGAGAQEILNRRVGRNELNAIEVCRSYVVAQRDYAYGQQDMRSPREYARKFVSTPGQHDGLYWAVRSGEAESPIGPEMAAARAEGYGGTDQQAPAQSQPYHGYFYKILERQGPAAPGGARNYLVDGHMTNGFALLAFPAKYGESGVTSFIVNQDGLVYEKDLGRDTAALAPAIVEFNPDRTWTLP